MGWFVDIHSHVLPSGDDGAQSLREARALAVEAFRRGTGVLYATPHVWPHLPLTPGREVAVREAFAEAASSVPVELRLGFELTPMPRLLDEDPARYVLEGTDAVLVEVPFTGAVDVLLAVCEHVEAAGLRPIVAHPERTESVLERPGLARELAERGWPLQVNATSLLGRHGREFERIGWELLDGGLASIVASDGHRQARPPYLDEAYRAVLARVGETRARSLFDGSAVGAVAEVEAVPRLRSSRL